MTDRIEFLTDLRRELKARIDKYSAHQHRDNGPLEADFAEQAIQRQNDEVVDGLDIEAREELRQVDRALHRIEEGEGDICEQCGEFINPERLKILPQTTICVECAEERAG
ncbi:TraR/DksA family transcriptional regulator [Marinobacter halodurans]|uniref:TraR/DksA family transcriptional regulator n=1 Tax=Marinobacter halodurans TaxID=2528979 RepID=A0ABY1ZQC5_9GAMM|nr:TraR/DksA C4-type zinc finger protein [Marinobacter halodurans]TBW57968.1 TraR/DksA family transcriptional regulator [Marinobacter halodurans]